jgi:hypothetical protein
VVNKAVLRNYHSGLLWTLTLTLDTHVNASALVFVSTNTLLAIGSQLNTAAAVTGTRTASSTSHEIVISIDTASLTYLQPAIAADSVYFSAIDSFLRYGGGASVEMVLPTLRVDVIQVGTCSECIRWCSVST